jgi:signal peptidase II
LRPGLLAALLVALIDQAAKLWAIAAAPPPPGWPVPLPDGMPFGLSLALVHNPGIFFGTLLPAGGWPQFMVLTLVVMVAVVLLLRMLGSRRVLLNIGRGLVVGGAASNLADRMRLGAVVDYLVIRRGDIGLAINIADLAIIGGAALMIGWAATYALTSKASA